MKRTLAVLLLVLLGLAACTDKKSSNPNPNRPPETHLFLVFGDSLGSVDSTATPDTSASMLVLYWYGDDPDGEIIGYEWAWDDTVSDTAWTFTDLVMDTFYVKIRSVAQDFTFFIRAVDSDSAVDPTPSLMTFPVVNSPPTVNFPQTFINDYSSEVSITLGYHTFTWVGSDPDGDETISGYELALMDTSFHWIPDPGDSIDDEVQFAGVDWTVFKDSLTFTHSFTDIDPGCYRVFLRAYDIAGAYSSVKYYPEETGLWQVLPANGEILYVDDNQYFSGAADSVYIDILDSLGLEYTALSFQDKAFYYAQDFELALNDFQLLIYNAGTSRHFAQTGSAITNFINEGGQVFMNATFSVTDTIRYTFMPVDTIYRENVTRPNIFVKPDGSTGLDNYPDTLETTQAFAFSNTFTFSPTEPEGLVGEGIQALYVIGSVQSGNPDDIAAIGDTVAVRFPYDPEAITQEPPKLLFFSMPVFDCGVNDSFRELLSYVLLNEIADE